MCVRKKDVGYSCAGVPRHAQEYQRKASELYMAYLVKYGLVAVRLGTCHQVKTHHTTHGVPDALVLPVFLRARNRYPQL